MNRKLLLGKLFIILSFIFLVGCEKKGLIGDWVYFDGTKTRSDIYYTFKDDKNGTYNFGGGTRNFTYTIADKKITILYDGDTNSSSYEYQLEDDTFTIKDSFGSNIIYKRK